MAEKIERRERNLAYSGAILDIYADTMVLPDGSTQMWDYVEHRNGAAAVLAVRDDGKLLMVRQYRNALERETIEIPAGARDSRQEPSIECASRELEEETGFKCEELEYLMTVHTTVAFCNEKIDIFLARDLIPSKQNLDEGESIDVEAWDIDELCDMIYTGELQDSKTVSAILAYKNKYLNKIN